MPETKSATSSIVEETRVRMLLVMTSRMLLEGAIRKDFGRSGDIGGVKKW